MALVLDAMTLPQLVGPDGWPLFLFGGAAPEDDDDPDDPGIGDDDDEPGNGDGDPDDDDDPDGGGEPDEWAPPSRDEWERVQSALGKANAEAKKHRLRAKELTRKQEADQQARERAAAESEGRTEQYEQALAAAAEAEQRYKPLAVRSAARAAFLEVGLRLDPAAPDRSAARLKSMIRMLDLDEIEIDDDGEVVGLDTQIAEIKDSYPELFGPLQVEPPVAKRKVRRIDAAAIPDSGYEASLTTGEKIAQQVLGDQF